jgi:hypothetical protein
MKELFLEISEKKKKEGTLRVENKGQNDYKVQGEYI